MCFESAILRKGDRIGRLSPAIDCSAFDAAQNQIVLPCQLFVVRLGEQRPGTVRSGRVEVRQSKSPEQSGLFLLDREAESVKGVYSQEYLEKVCLRAESATASVTEP